MNTSTAPPDIVLVQPRQKPAPSRFSWPQLQDAFARTGNWDLPFFLAAGLAVLSSLIFVFLVSTKPVVIPELDSVTPREPEADSAGARSR